MHMLYVGSDGVGRFMLLCEVALVNVYVRVWMCGVSGVRVWHGWSEGVRVWVEV